MFAVFKRELRAYFSSPIGYVVIGMFLFMMYNFRKNIKECSEFEEEPVDDKLQIF